MNKEQKINNIVSICDDLQANDTFIVKNFGSNKDLTLYIHKDYQYNIKTGEYNLVTISTRQNGEWVDDVGDTHIDDLYIELERIYEYKNFETM